MITAKNEWNELLVVAGARSVVFHTMVDIFLWDLLCRWFWIERGCDTGNLGSIFKNRKR